jgi:hypothetical protein
MNQINRIVKNKIKFTSDGKVLTGLICKHFKRIPVNAQIYIVAVGNDIYLIHEILSGGQTVSTEVFKLQATTDLKELYAGFMPEFDYYLVDEATS